MIVLGTGIVVADRDGRDDDDDEIPDKVMNRKTGEQLSFSNCASCHKRALQGSYNEHEIDVPGIGRWDD